MWGDSLNKTSKPGQSFFSRHRPQSRQAAIGQIEKKGWHGSKLRAGTSQFLGPYSGRFRGRLFRVFPVPPRLAARGGKDCHGGAAGGAEGKGSSGGVGLIVGMSKES